MTDAAIAIIDRRIAEIISDANARLAELQALRNALLPPQPTIESPVPPQPTIETSEKADT